MCRAQISNGRPIISAIVLFPAHLKQGVTPPILDFLVDTGADKTLINAIDAEKLGIKYRMSASGEPVATYDDVPLQKGPIMGGIGGGIQTFEVSNASLIMVTWVDNNIVESHEEPLQCLYVPDGRARAIPNLLGRDVISRFNLNIQAVENSVELVRAAIPGSYTVTHL